MSPRFYVKMHPLARLALASKRVETRRRVPNVPDCDLLGLSAGRKEKALPRRVELQLGVGSKVRSYYSK